MSTVRTRLSTAAIVAVAAVALAPATAGAIDHSKGHPGYCRTDTGVTVVVDFQDLGGTPIVRCAPKTTRGTGLDALKGAGFQIAGVQRWGEAFVCRIENRPSAVEELPIRGHEGYREACVDTPPAAGYWSYWHAGNNCQWEYSQWGAKNRDFVPGGFEGWSFSLNATADANPQPRVAAVRPGTSGRPCVAPDEPEPASNDPHVRQQPNPGVTPGTDGGTGDLAGDPDPSVSKPSAGGDATLPPPKPPARAKPTADDPANNVAFTGGEHARDVADVIEEQSGASGYAPWVAGVVIVLLGLATWLTARRRRRARET